MNNNPAGSFLVLLFVIGLVIGGVAFFSWMLKADKKETEEKRRRNNLIDAPSQQATQNTAYRPDTVIEGEVVSTSQPNPSTALAPAPSARPAPIRPRAVVYDICVPKDGKWQPEKALAFIEHVLSQMGGTAALRIVAEKDMVRWQMVDYLVEWENFEAVAKGIRTIHPEAEVTVSDYNPPAFTQPFYRQTIPFVLGNIKVGWIAPTKFVEGCKANDPLTHVVQGLADELKEGSRAIFTVSALGATDNMTRQQGRNALKQSNVNWVAVGANLIFGGAKGWVSTGVDLASMAASGNMQTDKYRAGDQAVAEAKPLLKSLWDMFIVVQVDAADQSD